MWARDKFREKVDFLCVSVTGEKTANQFIRELGLQQSIVAFCEKEMPRFGQLGCSGFIVFKGDGTMESAKTPPFLQHGDQAFRFVENMLQKLCTPKFLWPFELQQKKVGELKQLAQDAKINLDVCLEKKDFVDALKTHFLEKQSVGNMKRLLQGVGVDTSGCLEKKDYFSKITAYIPSAQTDQDSKPDTPREPYEFKADLCGDICGDGRARKKPCPDDDSSKSNKAGAEFQGLANPPSVGNTVMDQEHKECVQSVNKLSQSRTLADLKTVLYTFAEHFEDEEKLMEKKKFGGPTDSTFSAAVSHGKDHARILQEIQKIADRVEAASTGPASSVTDQDLTKVATLFDEHAKNFDMLYAGHI